MAKRTRTNKETRLVLRCTHCSLNQFLTVSGNCRRCQKLLVVGPAAEPQPVQDPVIELADVALPLEEQPMAVVFTPTVPCMVVYSTVGETIRQRRMELGFTQGSLARFLGWRATALCDMECDRRRPSLPLLKCLAYALQCTLADLTPASPAREKAA